MRSIQDQAQDQSGEQLRIDRAYRGKEHMAVTKRTHKTTPIVDGSLAAIVAERNKTNGNGDGDAPMAGDVQTALQSVILTDCKREPVPYRENIGLAVSADGFLTVKVDVSNAVEVSDAGYGQMLVSTRWQNASTGKWNSYVQVAPNIRIRLDVVITNKTYEPKELNLDLRNGQLAGHLNRQG